MEDEKKVILPMEEYERLKADSEALTLAREELKKDCQERGYYVELSLRWDGNAFSHYTGRRYIDSTCAIRIITKDQALEVANDVIKELQADKQALLKEVRDIKDDLHDIQSRNLIQRIFHKY